jgi:hypothetical protein
LLGLLELPRIELQAVAQAEAGNEIAAGKPYSLFKAPGPGRSTGWKPAISRRIST